MHNLLAAIKKTKKYAANYGQILNSKQLYLRLISPEIFEYKEVKKYGKSSNENKEWIKKYLRAKKLIEIHLSKMETILMVGITGSVAAEKSLKNEDIDLLIVTRANELWWTRLYLRFYVWFFRIPHRKYNEAEKKNEFCFNMWLDENNMGIPKEKRGLKNALDLVMMKVVYDKENCYQRFLKKNDWAAEYVATGYKERIKKIKNQRKPSVKTGRKWLNTILFWIQFEYMKRNRTPKFVEKGRAFFHDEKKV